MTSLAQIDVHSGRTLAPNEQIVWEGKPALGALAIRAFHVRPVASYFVLLAAVGFGRALGGHVPFVAALMPLATGAVVLGFLYIAAFGVARSTHYIITTRRVILRYGVVFPRALSLPFRQISSMSVSVGQKQCGDVALMLHDGNHMPYLKLWPHARPWHLRTPQPMLRSINQAGSVATLLSRVLSKSEQDDARRRHVEIQPVPAKPAILQPATA
jgi:hypothetical protein